jgi:DNA polymerase V
MEWASEYSSEFSVQKLRGRADTELQPQFDTPAIERVVRWHTLSRIIRGHFQNGSFLADRLRLFGSFVLYCLNEFQSSINPEHTRWFESWCHLPQSWLEESTPLFIVTVPAGFPSPAEDYAEGPLDLNQHLIRHPAATFFVRVKGDSMTGVGIYSGDLLIVDRAVTPTSGSIVIAVVDGELTIKRFHQSHGQITLLPENPAYQPIEIGHHTAFTIWGVVTKAIHFLEGS